MLLPRSLASPELTFLGHVHRAIHGPACILNSIRYATAFELAAVRLRDGFEPYNIMRRSFEEIYPGTEFEYAEIHAKSSSRLCNFPSEMQKVAMDVYPLRLKSCPQCPTSGLSYRYND